MDAGTTHAAADSGPHGYTAVSPEAFDALDEAHRDDLDSILDELNGLLDKTEDLAKAVTSGETASNLESQTQEINDCIRALYDDIREMK